MMCTPSCVYSRLATMFVSQLLFYSMSGYEINHALISLYPSSVCGGFQPEQASKYSINMQEYAGMYGDIALYATILYYIHNISWGY